MRSPRVLVVTPDFPPARGGIQVLVHRLVTSWERVDAHVVTLAARGASNGYRSVQRVRAPRVVDRRTEVAVLNAAAVAEGLRFRPHVVLSAHVATSPAATVLKRVLGTPYVQYLHGKEVTARRGLTAFALREADAAVAVSRYTESLALELGADPARVHRIPPGVDLAPPPARGPRAPVAVMVARLDERYKGHDVVLRALPLVRARVPDARLVVVGDGALRPYYEGLAASFGVASAVEFAGAVDDDAKAALLERAAAFLMPSRVEPNGGGEGFGIVYLEAATRGVPVVAGNVAGALDAVRDGETGLLVDPTDHVAVADALTRLLSRADDAAALGGAGVEHAVQFAWPTIARRVEDVVLSVAGGAA